jgi:Exonuclease
MSPPYRLKVPLPSQYIFLQHLTLTLSRHSTTHNTTHTYNQTHTHIYMHTYKNTHTVDQGCIFVGHGLKKDFRIINLIVPPAQIIDTVDLFNLRHQRKLSLRFLAFFLLGVNIQQQTHCSIEDAKTALAVYSVYCKLVQENRFEKVLQDIYHYGRSSQWKVAPRSIPSGVQTSMDTSAIVRPHSQLPTAPPSSSSSPPVSPSPSLSPSHSPSLSPSLSSASASTPTGALTSSTLMSTHASSSSTAAAAVASSTASFTTEEHTGELVLSSNLGALGSNCSDEDLLDEEVSDPESLHALLS